MHKEDLIVGVTILVIILLLWWCTFNREHVLSDITPDEIKAGKFLIDDPTLMLDERGVNILSPEEFDKLSDGERLDYLIEKYFRGISVGDPESMARKNRILENRYLKSLPRDSSTCSDHFKSCTKWAKNGECRINPAFMLYGCSKSCKACKLNPGQKYKVADIHNGRDPKHCVYHAEEYPSLVRMELEQIFGII